jgi:archaea-specific DNA-binding protein
MEELQPEKEQESKQEFPQENAPAAPAEEKPSEPAAPQQPDVGQAPEENEEKPAEPAPDPSEPRQPEQQAAKTPEELPARTREQRDPNTIYVGRKPVMSYVLAAVTLFNNGSPRVKLKARGRAISRAVDVEEIIKSRFFNGLKVSGFEIGTEELTNEDGSQSRVSSLLLTLEK